MTDAAAPAARTGGRRRTGPLVVALTTFSVTALALAACSSAPAQPVAAVQSSASSAISSPSSPGTASASSASPSGSATPSKSARPSATRKPATKAATSTPPRVAGQPLAGKVVGIDPGHNGRNYTDPAFINQWIWNGREKEHCNTTGTSTNAGYTEALYNFMVASYLAADLRAQGAKVVTTRSSNSGVGPCVTTRAAIINAAHADVAVDIHADGGPPGGRGFTLLEPVADGPNNAIIKSSAVFGTYVRSAFVRYAGMPVSTYDGVNGVQPRDNLAGLNLTTVPEVLIECGNMRNATDAALLSTTAFQKRAAAALDAAIVAYLG